MGEGVAVEGGVARGGRALGGAAKERGGDALRRAGLGWGRCLLGFVIVGEVIFRVDIVVHHGPCGTEVVVQLGAVSTP